MFYSSFFPFVVVVVVDVVFFYIFFCYFISGLFSMSCLFVNERQYCEHKNKKLTFIVDIVTLSFATDESSSRTMKTTQFENVINVKYDLFIFISSLFSFSSVLLFFLDSIFYFACEFAETVSFMKITKRCVCMC